MVIITSTVVCAALFLLAAYLWTRWSMRTWDKAYEQRSAVIDVVGMLSWEEMRKHRDVIENVSLDQHAEAVRWRQPLVKLYGAEICNLMQWR